MDLDLDRLRRTLGDPALERLVERLARRVELGRPLTGALVLPGPSDGEVRALRALLGSGRPRPGAGSVAVDLDRLATALAAAGVAPDLRSAVVALTGAITPRDVVRDADRRAREEAARTLGAGRHAGTAWYDAWAAELAADGTLTRLLRRAGIRLVADAVAVLDRTPARGVPIQALAEHATGDTKALAGTPLAGLVLRALALRAGAAPPRTAEDERRVWEAAGVIVDDLASQVLVLGLPARGDAPLAGWLTEAARLGTPFRITLHQLVSVPVVPSAEVIHVCENPSVLRSAVTAGATGPLICTEGVPSAACNRLLTAAAESGATIRWRGDFDWTGLRTTARAIDRYSAVPWRMAAADYTAALERGGSEPLRGAPAPSPWDPSLADRLHATGRAVMEERLIPLLLADLSEYGTGDRRPQDIDRGREPYDEDRAG